MLQRPTATALLLAASALSQTGWVQRQPAMSPPPRGWHQLAHDLVRGTTLLFGGDNGIGQLNDTWEWNGTAWMQHRPPLVPSPRWGHAMAYDLARQRVVLFGGATTGFFGDTWTWDGTNWAQQQPVNSPSIRTNAAMAWLQTANGVILFGGWGPSGRFAETWQWNGSSWTQLNPGLRPPPRDSHGMASDLVQGRVLVFGGYDGSSNFDDLWAFDGTNWTPIGSPNPGPQPLGNTALAFDVVSGVAIQFGGFFGRFPPIPVGETWLHDGTQWIPDLRTGAPGRRRSFAMVYQPTSGTALLFGGYVGGNSTLGDTWEYRVGRPARWRPFGAGCSGSNGVPVLRCMAAGRPVLASPWILELTATAGSAAAFVHGLSTTAWNGNNLPLDLAGFGMPGCRLFVAPDVTALLPVSNGMALQLIQVPADSALLGLEFASQGFVLAPGGNALGVVAANAGAATIGEF